jgi:hypothetical protein
MSSSLFRFSVILSSGSSQKSQVSRTVELWLLNHTFLWPLATNGDSQSLQNLNSNANPLFVFRGHVRSEQSLACQKKIIKSTLLLFRNAPDSLFSVLETRASSTAKNYVSFMIVSLNQCLFTCDDDLHEILIRLCLLKEISGDRQAVFLLLDVENTRNEFRRNVSRVQMLCESGLLRTDKICQPLQKLHALLIAYVYEFAQVAQNHHLCMLTVAWVADRR